MNLSILQLDHYIFTEVEVKCCFSAENASAETGPARVEVEHMNYEIQQIGDVSEKERSMLVRLKVNTLDNESCHNLKYKFSMEAMATLSMRPEAPSITPASMEKVLVMNGVNLLYGMMREKLNSLTSAMLWGQLLLPLVTFDGISKLDSIRVEDQKPASEKKQPRRKAITKTK